MDGNTAGEPEGSKNIGQESQFGSAVGFSFSSTSS